MLRRGRRLRPGERRSVEALCIINREEGGNDVCAIVETTFIVIHIYTNATTLVRYKYGLLLETKESISVGFGRWTPLYLS